MLLAKVALASTSIIVSPAPSVPVPISIEPVIVAASLILSSASPTLAAFKNIAVLAVTLSAAIKIEFSVVALPPTIFKVST
jgi:hypothetical protein